MVCAQKGYPLVIVMAESFSVERRRLMRFLGAKVVLTPAAGRAAGMVAKVQELAAKNGWFQTRQFENEANPDVHSRTTAQEILRDFEGQKLDFWVTGFGTGGTLGYEDEKFSYLVVARAEIAMQPTTARIIKQPAIKKFGVELPLCMPDGLETRLIRKQDAAAFKAVRKLGWGDSLD
jgi:cysteine synthase